MATKTEVLREHLPRYLKASRKEKVHILNHLTAVLGMHRKAVIRRLHTEQMRDRLKPKKKPGRHVIRRFVGYIRLDCPEAVDALNTVYDALIPYLMHFVAVRRTTGKQKIQSTYRRTYEKTAKTPYTRILEHPAVDEAIKERLRKEHSTLNPLLLKLEIERRIKAVYDTQKRYGKSPN